MYSINGECVGHMGFFTQRDEPNHDTRDKVVFDFIGCCYPNFSYKFYYIIHVLPNLKFSWKDKQFSVNRRQN